MVSISNLIFDELFSTVESIGVERTIKTLKDAKSNSLILKDLNIDFIITSSSEVTGVSKERILHGADRNDERKIAIALCVFFIKSELGYSLGEIKRILNKDESALSRYNSLVEKIKDNKAKIKSNFDKQLEDNYRKINLLITEKNLINGK